VTPLERLLLERIRRAGPIPFFEYMSAALYDPEHGYYAAGRERTGWRGHFVTSAEIGPAFGGLWTRFFERVWRACERPRRFVVTELGPGEGSFAEAVLGSAQGEFAGALSYRLIEPVPELESRQRARLAGRTNVSWERSLGDAAPAPGCVFANEVLDNLTVHLLERNKGALREIYVGEDRGSLRLELGPPVDAPVYDAVAAAGIELAEGRRAEISIAARALLEDAAATIARGAVVVVDYGLTSGDLHLRPHGTLATYGGSGARGEVLSEPGRRDITAHVNWTWVRSILRAAGLDVVGPVPQRDVLDRLGATALDRSLLEDQEHAARAGDGAALVRALSRRGALGALRDRAGLGAFGAMVGYRGVPDALADDDEGTGPRRSPV
jgi:SAM-dependent MidA family methyltransferase